MFVTMMCVQAPNWDSVFENSEGIHFNVIPGSVRWWHGHNSNRLTHPDRARDNEYPAYLIGDHITALDI